MKYLCYASACYCYICGCTIIRCKITEMSTELRILFCTFYTLMLLSCQNYEPPRINYNSIEQELLQDTAGIHNPELIREIVAFFKREITNIKAGFTCTCKAPTKTTGSY